MFLFSFTATLLAAPLVLAGDYLPADRTKWWDAEPPPTAKFTKFDTIEGWFHEPILHVFDPHEGSGDPRAVFIRPANGNPPVPTYIPVIEDGTRVTRTVIRNGPDVPITGEPGTPNARLPMKLDFPIPQRAVVLQFGLQCHEGFDCSAGFDASDIELVAYDPRGFVVGSTSLWQTERDTPVEELRTDLLIGIRDQESRIATVHLIVRGPSPINAVQLLRRVYQETLPPAVTKEVTVPPHTPLTLPLPYNCDIATVVSRGFHLYDDSSTTLNALMLFTANITSRVADGEVTITAGGEHVVMQGTEILLPVPVEEMYGTVLCWDSTQVQLNQYTTTTTYSGNNEDSSPKTVLDPCRNGLCGNNPPPSLAMTSGYQFDWLHGPNLNPDEFLYNVEAGRTLFIAQGNQPTIQNPSPHLVDLDGWLLAEMPESEDDSYFFRGHLRRVVFGGQSLSWRSNSFPLFLNVPDMYTLPASIPGSPSVHYPDDLMENLGYYCDMEDATMALVGVETALVHPGGQGLTEQSDRAFIKELDVEIRARFIGDRVTARVAGGIDISESLRDDPFEGDHGQIFATPACIGVSPVFQEGQPLAQALTFVAVPGQSQPPNDGGALYNIGNVPFTIHAASLTGDTADFKLDVTHNGVYKGKVDNLGQHNSLIMKPGDVLEINGLFAPTGHSTREALIQFETSVGGGTTVEMPVTGRVPDPVAWFPQDLQFGSVISEYESPRLNAMIIPLDALSVTVNSVYVDQDDHGDFHVRFSGPQTVNPGDSLVMRTTFQPRRMEPQVRTAVVVAETNLGTIELPVSGDAVAPPQSIAEWSRSQIQFGLQYEGIDSQEIVELRSVGARPIHITDVYLVGHPDFSLPSLTLPVLRSRGESLLVTVNFTPFDDETGSTRRSATLVAVTDEGPLALDVTGWLAPPQFL